MAALKTMHLIFIMTISLDSASVARTHGKNPSQLRGYLYKSYSFPSYDCLVSSQFFISERLIGKVTDLTQEQPSSINQWGLTFFLPQIAAEGWKGHHRVHKLTTYVCGITGVSKI